MQRRYMTVELSVSVVDVTDVTDVTAEVSSRVGGPKI